MLSLEQLFKALADATRLRILALLIGGEVCVCDIHETLRITQPKASRHLAYLRRARLVDTRRDGLWIHYRLADRPDAVQHSVSQAVHRALANMEVVQRDRERLKRTTAPIGAIIAGGAKRRACGPMVAATQAPRRRRAIRTEGRPHVVAITST